MDINLPGIDGYQALLRLRGDPETAGIPVIALTANAMKGERERGLAAGFAEYLTKPLDIIQLLDLLSKLLQR
jgi:CheY-like chemotaxis protein